MSEKNKAVVERFINYLRDKDAAGACGMIAPGGRYWVPPSIPAAPGTTKEGTPAEVMREIFRLEFASMDGDFDLRIVNMIAEGDYVAAQVTGKARFKDGFDYENEYGFFIRLKDGVIQHVKEYMDGATAMTLAPHIKGLAMGEPV